MAEVCDFHEDMVKSRDLLFRGVDAVKDDLAHTRSDMQALRGSWDAMAPKLQKLLDGNGKPPLDTRLATLEASEIARVQREAEQRVARTRAFWGVAATLLFALMSLGASLFVAAAAVIAWAIQRGGAW